MRRVGLYSLIAFVALALVGVLAAGVGGALDRGNDKVSQANTPTVAAPPAPETAPETAPEETEEEKTEEEQQQAAEEQTAQEQNWREIAEQRGAGERAAAERQAAEQQAAEEAQPTIPTNTALSLTVPGAGIQNDPVTNSVSESVLANGAGKIPSTGFPWQAGANTYIAAHVYG